MTVYVKPYSVKPNATTEIDDQCTVNLECL